HTTSPSRVCRAAARPSAPARPAGAPRVLGPLLPDAAQVNDRLDRLLEILRRDPLDPRVEALLAGEDVGGRQPHEAELRAVGAAADRGRDRLEPRAPHRLARVRD